MLAMSRWACGPVTKCVRNIAEVETPVPGAAWFFMSAMPAAIALSYSLSMGIGHTFSPETRAAAIIALDSCLSLQNRPALVDPSATPIAPVSVARSIVERGLYLLQAQARASARHKRPSASAYNVTFHMSHITCHTSRITSVDDFNRHPVVATIDITWTISGSAGHILGTRKDTNDTDRQLNTRNKGQGGHYCKSVIIAFHAMNKIGPVAAPHMSHFIS